MAAILKEYKGKIRLVDPTGICPEFKFQRGLKKWLFLNQQGKDKEEGAESYFTEYKNFDEVPEEMRTYLKDTMMSSTYE